jgi:hypothetical protein
MKTHDLFNAGAVSSMMDEHLAGKLHHSRTLWASLAFRVWEEHWR